MKDRADDNSTGITQCMWVPNEWVRESKNPLCGCQEPLRPSSACQAGRMESARKCL